MLNNSENLDKDYVMYRGDRYYLRDGRLEFKTMGVSSLSEIEGLQGIKNLRELDLTCCNIHKIKGFEIIQNIKVLNLENNKIRQIEGLDSLIELEELNLFYNEITEIKGLNNLSSLCG